MKQRLISILSVILVLHLIASLTFIVDPVFLVPSGFSRFYKARLLPGPFFSASKISDNHTFYLSWKVNDQWRPPINTTRDNINLYRAHFNPTQLYRSRLSQRLYLRLFSEQGQLQTEIKDQKEFLQLKEYLNDHSIPKEADSVKLLIIKKHSSHFSMAVDSIHITFAR
jgi:hypothetical protein